MRGDDLLCFAWARKAPLWIPGVPLLTLGGFPTRITLWTYNSVVCPSHYVSLSVASAFATNHEFDKLECRIALISSRTLASMLIWLPGYKPTLMQAIHALQGSVYKCDLRGVSRIPIRYSSVNVCEGTRSHK